MKVVGFVFPEVRRLVNFIQRRQGDCESLYGKKTWYGKDISCLTLHCSYGAIGYSIEYDGVDVQVDCELGTITIDYGSWVDAFQDYFKAPKKMCEFKSAVEGFCGEVPVGMGFVVSDTKDVEEPDWFETVHTYKVKDVSLRVHCGDLTKKIFAVECEKDR